MPVSTRVPSTTERICSTLPMPFWVERIQVRSPMTGRAARMAPSVW